ncbi:alpha-keto acid decarboxylase family protein [Methanobacterium sp. ACI-7]|uniref:alpha-keto acid decarboxylase family protein n=1 Tax=unclassified Methanobacterium TaxID=2627676 RepID=UPI0039C23E9F
MEYTIGSYLAKRLEQMGIEHYFVVPGDFNLMLLDELLKNNKLKQIGGSNELNAAYAAEGYARVRGAAAVVVTFNVGAFSAINGIASAYAERLPVIFISGGFNTNDQIEGNIPHHTLQVKDLNYQYDMIQKITCDAAQIMHEKDAPHLIDRVIHNALTKRLPGYIEIPCNLADAPCPEPAPFENLFSTLETDPKALESAVNAAVNLIENSDTIIILAGPHLRAYGAISAFNELGEALGCAVAVQPNAKSFFAENNPQFIGIYWGEVSSPGCQEIVEGADLIIAGGPVYTDYSTVGWTAIPKGDKTINIRPSRVVFPNSEHSGIRLASFLKSLAKRVKKNKSSLEKFNQTESQEEVIKSADPEAMLTRKEMIRQIYGLIDSKSTLFVESGDSWFNTMYMNLPEGAKYEIEMQWGSIGWSLPAAFGYSLGNMPDGRVLALIGDGSFQFTAQEVSNIIRYNQDPILFIVNNHGYVVESVIHEGPYNYIKNWDYSGLMDIFNANEGEGLGVTAKTAGELSEAIKKAKDHHKGPVLIECQIDHDDTSPELSIWGSKVAEANKRPPII